LFYCAACTVTHRTTRQYLPKCGRESGWMQRNEFYQPCLLVDSSPTLGSPEFSIPCAVDFLPLTNEERGNKMLQKDLNEENKEIKNLAYELYEKHGFKNGNDYVDWLEAERLAGKHPPLIHKKHRSNLMAAIVGILCVIVAILLFMLFQPTPKMELSQKSLSQLKLMMLVLDPKPDEEVAVFGDTHFDFDKSTLTSEAKALLDKDIQVLKDNPKVNVRMAGYTSAQGTEETNQKLSEERANTVRDYLTEKGIKAERITVIGYGRTKPALYEVSPGEINSPEAKANMRVLFEIVVK
jgi:outer membrane protein OmpA-like peptidoglycan-associated protein